MGRARALLRIAWVIAATTVVSTLAFVVLSLTRRPDNPVEAELLYEALRVARGLPLYIDPSVGAFDDGSPPSRFYVLYTPLWPSLLGHIGSPTFTSLRFVGRSIAAGAWLFMHIAPILAAPRTARLKTLLAAAIAMGVWFLSRNAPAATPDTLAVALACAGACRAARSGKIDATAAVLLVLAPFVKPSALGIVAGSFIVHIVRRPPGWKKGLLAALATVVIVGVGCHLASGGVWLEHIARSTGQPLSASRAFVEIGSRVFVLGAPHLIVAIIAWRARASAVVLGPLVTSIAWSSFAMAKFGSGSHYWLEPTAMALVAIAFMPPIATTAQRHIAWGAAALAAVVAGTSVPAYAREIESYKTRTEAIAAIDQHCRRTSGEVVVSTDIALEIALNGRFIVPSWQSSFLVRKQRFPLAAWRDDLDRVSWLVLPFDVTASSPDIARDPETNAFDAELRDVVMRDFVFDRRLHGLYVYRRSPVHVVSHHGNVR